MNPATTSAQALQNLQQFQSGMQKPEDILTGQEQQLGIPQAQTQVQGLRGAIQNTTNLLNNVAPSVYGRTQNSLETNAQASRNIQNEQAPLSATLDKQNTDYGNQENDLQNLLSRAGTLSTLKAQGQDSQLGYLKDIYSALYGQEQDSAKMAEQQREFDAAQATSRASSGGGISLGGLGLGGSSSPTIQDQAYKAVQAFLKGSNAQILSDYNATLKSANYGNALDKLKVQLYQQARPDLFKNAGVLSTIKSAPQTINTNVGGLKF